MKSKAEIERARGLWAATYEAILGESPNDRDRDYYNDLLVAKTAVGVLAWVIDEGPPEWVDTHQRVIDMMAIELEEEPALR